MSREMKIHRQTILLGVQFTTQARVSLFLAHFTKRVNNVTQRNVTYKEQLKFFEIDLAFYLRLATERVKRPFVTSNFSAVNM
jgi:hypothetical protein